LKETQIIKENKRRSRGTGGVGGGIIPRKIPMTDRAGWEEKDLKNWGWHEKSNLRRQTSKEDPRGPWESKWYLGNQKTPGPPKLRAGGQSNRPDGRKITSPEEIDANNASKNWAERMMSGNRSEGKKKKHPVKRGNGCTRPGKEKKWTFLQSKAVKLEITKLHRKKGRGAKCKKYVVKRGPNA